MTVSISKSKYVAGLQCPKLLWTQYNDKGLIPPPEPGKQAVFDVGHQIGDLAKKLYPDGIEVPWSRDLSATAAATRELLPLRKPIFEASFDIDGCYCRADLLVPAAGGAWDLYEVKSATRVKDVNIADVAFQAHAIERSGLKLNRLYLMHIDNTYVRQGALDPAALFHATDITAQARARQPEIAARVAAMLTVIAGACPEVPIGEHCSDPYECDLWKHCSAFLPEHHVLQLHGIRKRRAFALMAEGIAGIVDIPTSELSGIQLIQQEAVRTGQPQVRRDEISRWLAGLRYPLYCFDFETMNAAVPLIDGTRPYQQVPFQFSLHIVDSPGAAPRHFEHLAETRGDPRPALIDALKTIGPDGTILCYNMSFEKGIIKALAREFPPEAGFLHSLDGRFMDLMTPFSRFSYHDARQHGSCSLKDVLPVMTATSYEGLAIAEGGQAMREFQRAVFTDVEPSDKSAVLANLRAYCRQDTLALVEVLEALRKVV